MIKSYNCTDKKRNYMNVLITISLKRCLKSLKEVQYEVPFMMQSLTRRP
jgi:hypothetical protein